MKELLDRIKRARELDKFASKGPWKFEYGFNNGGLPTGFFTVPEKNRDAEVEMLENDCIFIVESRELLLKLANDCEELLEKNEELQSELNNYRKLW